MLYIHYIIHSILAGNGLQFSLENCANIWIILNSFNVKKKAVITAKLTNIHIFFPLFQGLGISFFAFENEKIAYQRINWAMYPPRV